jgi:putative ABC transport system ATP-binding protein
MTKPIEGNKHNILPPSSSDTRVDSIAMDVKNLSKVFYSSSGRFVALKGINFLVKKGEFVSVVGPSGSGKSTLLNILGALDRPTSGKIYINGVDIFALRNA